MLFNSLHFVVFFPIVVMLYFALPYRFRWVLLLAASYYFYMCWRPAYIILIVASTLVDYFAAITIERTDRLLLRRLCLLASLTANFGLLFTFKYFNFFSTSIAAMLDMYGVQVEPVTLGWLLPVGISFYTFQTVSYTIDVYRGQQTAEKHLGVFALYVSFFPQLVAGPIERASHLLPQFYEKHSIDWDRIRQGLLLMLGGFFKKLVIADRLAHYVSAVYDNPHEYSGLPFVLAIYFFTIQIYADFSGYADIAIGAAQIMGYDLRENFRRPFYSKSISEFWRRWHISLSSWMRDYIFIPLGGSRGSKARTYRNLFLVFLFAGLWHGANWTYVVWGGLHGVYLIVGAATKPFRERITRRLFPGRLERFHQFIQIVITFHLFAFSMVIFRVRRLSEVFTFVSESVKNFSLDHPLLYTPLSASDLVIAVVAIGLMEVVHLLQRRGPVRTRVLGMPLPVRWAAYFVLLFGILVFGDFGAQEFIYFQF